MEKNELEERRNDIFDFAETFDFPDDAAAAFVFAWERICANPESGAIFRSAIGQYEAGELTDYGGMMRDVRAAADACGVHRYTAEMLIYLLFTRHLRELYREKGYSEEMFAGVGADLRCKLIECRQVRGVDGFFEADWFARFFNLTRFALGRLQFETAEYAPKNGEPFNTVCGKRLGKGDRVVSVHIPSTGPLDHEAVLRSYRWADEFYRSYFGGEETVLQCGSWLLYRPMLDFLPETSRIRAFLLDFNPVAQTEDPAFHNCWRIFGKDYAGTPADLPRDTSLRRAYAEWIERGGVPGTGFGVIVMRDGRPAGDARPAGPAASITAGNAGC